MVQNKILPGSYINFVSAARATAVLSDRGIATIPLSLDWGPDNTVFAVTSEDLQKNSLAVFGHAYTDDALKPIRELFCNARLVYLYKLNTGGAAARNAFGKAKYTGTAGNQIKIVVAENEHYEADTSEIFDVSTYFGTTLIETQMGVASTGDLLDNDYVAWDKTAALTLTAGTPMTGGDNGSVEDATYQTYLDKIEPYSFHTMGCTSTDGIIKRLFANFTKRLREEQGVKFQTVLFRYSDADYEGVISVENGLVGAKDDPAAAYWMTGAQAGCAVNKSLTNAVYTGEYDIDTEYTQSQLADGIQSGKLLFHLVYDEVHVLTDINTLTTVTEEKGEDFQSNQTMRVLDQIGNDIAALFNTKYLGKAPNDNAGRISLKTDIVSHHNQLQTIRAIENFDSENVTVEQGSSKKSVVVTDAVTPVNAMEQLYMTVVVS